MSPEQCTDLGLIDSHGVEHLARFGVGRRKGNQEITRPRIAPKFQRSIVHGLDDSLRIIGQTRAGLTKRASARRGGRDRHRIRSESLQQRAHGAIGGSGSE
jgi:hypothetical protein